MKSDPGPGRLAEAPAVRIGTVSRANGLSGAVVVHLHPSMHDVVRRGLAVRLERDGAPSFPTRVRSAAPIRGGLRVTLDGIGDRNAAEAAVGCAVTVDRDALGGLAEGEFLDSDIVGLEVVTTGGHALGRVAEVVATGANDVWVVKDDTGAEVLVPAVAHAVAGVDLAGRRITVVAEALEYGAAPRAGETRPEDAPE